MPQPPTVGRIVHYVSYGTPGGEYDRECRAAIVTAVPELLSEQPNDGHTASLAVLNPTGMFFNAECRHSEGARSGGTWHWPERTDAPPTF